MPPRIISATQGPVERQQATSPSGGVPTGARPLPIDPMGRWELRFLAFAPSGSSGCWEKVTLWHGRVKVPIGPATIVPHRPPRAKAWELWDMSPKGGNPGDESLHSSGEFGERFEESRDSDYLATLGPKGKVELHRHDTAYWASAEGEWVEGLLEQAPTGRAIWKDGEAIAVLPGQEKKARRTVATTRRGGDAPKGIGATGPRSAPLKGGGGTSQGTPVSYTHSVTGETYKGIRPAPVEEKHKGGCAGLPDELARLCPKMKPQVVYRNGKLEGDMAISLCLSALWGWGGEMVGSPSEEQWALGQRLAGQLGGGLIRR